MTLRSICIGLLLTSLFCHLEWGGGNSGFLFQLEAAIFKAETFRHSVTHPFVLFPLLGQLILLYCVFRPNKKIALVGMIGLSILVLMILLVGLVAMNYKIILSTLPFLAISVLFVIRYRSGRLRESKNL